MSSRTATAKRLLASWIVLLVTASLAGAADERQPSFLFLLADDQRRNTIAAHGNDAIDSPHLDRLVSRGYSFDRAYCMGSIHGAVCQPSRAMLMSGRTLYRVPMDLRGVTTLPEVLRSHGYRTFGTGKWRNGADSFLRSFAEGAAVFLGRMPNYLEVPGWNGS